jgi:hypothetical protein
MRLRACVWVPLALSMLPAKARSEINSFDYEVAAIITIGIHGQLHLHFRTDPNKASIPLLKSRFIPDVSSPMWPGEYDVEVIGFEIRNFVPMNAMDLEVQVRLPAELSPAPVTLRYREVLDENRQHELNKYERHLPERMQRDLWKVRNHVYQTHGPRLLNLVTQTSASGGIPRAHWIGHPAYRDGIEGVPSRRLDALEAMMEYTALRQDRRRANSGMDSASDLVIAGNPIDQQPRGHVAFTEFFPSGAPTEAGRQSLVRVRVIPQGRLSEGERASGSFWHQALVDLSTSLSIPDRDAIIEALPRLISGLPARMPIAGVWLRAPAYLRHMHRNRGRMTAEDLDFYPLSAKFPMWRFHLSREYLPAGHPPFVEIYREPRIVPYREILPAPSEADDAWRFRPNSPEETGVESRIAVWDEAFVAKHGPDATFRDLLEASDGCGSWHFDL